jgi:hypothetical protein
MGIKNTVLKERSSKLELTKYNDGNSLEIQPKEDQIHMLKDYLLHVLQYGTPEERVKILAGVNSKFELSNRRLELLCE